MSHLGDEKTLSGLTILKAETFVDWKWGIRSAFKSWNCWKIILGTETAPVPVDAAKITPAEQSMLANYEARVARALGALLFTATKSHRRIIEPHEDDPVAMWRALIDMYEVKDPGARFTASTALAKAGGHKELNETWIEYCNRIEELAYTLDNLRPEVWTLDQEIAERNAWYVLMALPDQHPVRVSLITQDDMTVAKIRSALVRHQVTTGLEPKSIESAHVAASPATHASPNDQCRYCHKFGHWEAACRKKQRAQRQEGPSGPHYPPSGPNGSHGNHGGDYGYKGRVQPNSGRERGYQGHQPYSGPAFANSAEANYGYLRYPQYPQFDERWAPPPSPSTPVPQQHLSPAFQGPPMYPAFSHFSPNPQPQQHQLDVANAAAEFAGNASQSLSPSSPIADADWIADSGASSHMTSYRNWLRDFKAVLKPVRLADGSIIYAEGEGWIRFLPVINGKTAAPFCLSRVLYVPRLKTNLLSTQSLTRGEKYSALFIGKRVEIREGNKIVLKGSINAHNTFYLDGKTETALAALTIGAPAEPLSLWHRRAAHKDPVSLVKAAQTSSVADLNIKVEAPSSEMCEPCIGAKQTRAPHTKPASRAERVLGRIFSDLHGPLPVEGRGGYKYWVTFIDDKSRYKAVYFLRKKSDTLQAFKEYKTLVENQLDLKIQCLRDDKGGEYMSAEFDALCTEHGIRREHTIRDTPQQNGVAERYNRTLAEGITALLLEARLPMSMWVDAASTFTYVHNRLPSTSLTGVTPFELWSGKKPSVSLLRVWGCLAYVHVQKDQRKSFESHTRKCIFIRYALNYKGWVFWDPETQKEVVSDSAMFNEQVFPGRMRAKSLPPIIPAHLGNFLAPIEPVQYNNELPNAPPTPSHDPAPSAAPTRRLSRDLAGIRDTPSFQSPQNLPPRRARIQYPAMYTVVESESEEEAAYFVEATVEFKTTDNTRPPDYLEITVEDGVEFALSTTTRFVPDTLQEALDSPDRDKWIAAAIDEIGAHLENKTWEVVQLPQGKRAIGCRWVFRIKVNADGTVDKYKGRIVAKGYAQKYGVDYTETFAPTARFGAVRTVVALAAIEDMELESVDITTAFLNAEIDAEIYVRKPDGYNPTGYEGPEWVLRLLKGLYGIKQGPHIWSVKLHEELRKIGFMRIETDHSVFVYEREAIKIIVPVHVDDLLLASKSLSEIAKVKEELKKVFKIHDLGPTKQILGIKVERDRPSRTIYLSQPAYIEDILSHYKMERCNPAQTPMHENTHLSEKMCPQDARELAKIDQGQYREAVGKLLYLSIATRPDIAYTVGVLCRYNSNPGKEHWDAVHHLLRYLRGTTYLRLMYSPTSHPHPFTAHSDADLGGNLDNQRSTAGHVLSVGTGAVMWGSRLQRQVSLSSTESEYTTASATGCEMMWMRFFLEELGYDMSLPSTLFLDSASAEQVVKNPDHQSTMKHVHRSYNWIRERVAEGDLVVQHVPGAENVADIFTKPLGPIKFFRFRDALGLR